MSMEVQVAETGPCSRSLTVKIPPTLVDEHLDKLFASARQQIQLKGFRPGKAPRALIEKKFGASILADAKEQMLNHYFGAACRDHDLQPVGPVRIDDVEKIQVTRGSPFEFTARIDIRPTIELKDVKGIEIPAYRGEADDEDIDKALEQIAHQKRSIGTVDEPAEDGDFLKVDLVFENEGGEVVRERKGAQLNTRMPIHGCDEKAYAESVLGAVAGKDLELAITFPDNFENEEVRGQKGRVKLHVHEILRVTDAPIDDELAKGMDFENLESLRNDLRTRISAEREQVGRQQQEEAAIQSILDMHEIDLPESLIEDQKKAALENLGQRLREEGGTDEEVEQRLRQADGEARQEAERRVKLFFLIDEIAKKHDITVDGQDFEREFEAIAAANQVTAAQVRQYLEENNRLGELQLALLERKVRDFLRENGKPVDKKGS